MDELEQAHLDYETRRSKICTDLKMIHDNTLNTIVRKILEDAIDFINEREV